MFFQNIITRHHYLDIFDETVCSLILDFLRNGMPDNLSGRMKEFQI